MAIMTLSEIKKDLDYWKTHSPECVLDFDSAYEWANQELKEKGMEAEGWAFDIEKISNIETFNVEFIAFNAYNRALIISREDAQKYTDNFEKDKDYNE